MSKSFSVFCITAIFICLALAITFCWPSQSQSPQKSEHMSGSYFTEEDNNLIRTIKAGENIFVITEQPLENALYHSRILNIINKPPANFQVDMPEEDIFGNKRIIHGYMTRFVLNSKTNNSDSSLKVITSSGKQLVFRLKIKS